MRRVVVFLKAPRPGFVKTRLIPVVGAEGAAIIYDGLIALTMHALREEETLELRYDPPEAEAEIAEWKYSDEWLLTPQGPGDLGTRIQRALDDGFDAGFSKVIIVGSDCPEIERSDIEEADLALNSDDVVLGPATDGGYWLIGVRSATPPFLENIRWSTEHARADTIQALTKRELAHALLRELTDIDTPEDLPFITVDRQRG